MQKLHYLLSHNFIYLKPLMENCIVGIVCLVHHYKDIICINVHKCLFSHSSVWSKVAFETLVNN